MVRGSRESSGGPVAVASVAATTGMTQASSGTVVYRRVVGDNHEVVAGQQGGWWATGALSFLSIFVADMAGKL